MPDDSRVDGNNNDTPSAFGEPRPQRDAPLPIVAHDVRTPLTVIRGQAQLLTRLVRRSELAGPQRVRVLRGLERIDTAVSELLALVERPPGPRSPPEQEPPSEILP